MALSFIQLSKTAIMAPHNCSQGSEGKAFPVCFLTASLNRLVSTFRSSAESSVSSRTPFSFFISWISTSKGSSSSFFSGFSPNTTSPYICTKRRYESHAKRGFPLFLTMASTDSSFNPRFRMVSIMPGIDALAPDRTDTRRGFWLSPNLGPATAFSISAICSSTSERIISMVASRPIRK